MSFIRSAAAAAAALGALVVLAALPTAAPALLDDPTGVLTWWETRGTAEASIAIVHLAALVFALYVAVVLVAVTASAALRFPRAATTLARFMPATIRRAITIGVVAGTLAAPTTATGQEAIVVVDIGVDHPTSAPITLTDLGEAEPLDEVSDPPPRSDQVDELVAVDSSFRESFRAGAVAATPDAWLVEPGDNLWSIAAAVLADERGEPADQGTLVRYWRSLITANAAEVADPDLIYPGQVLNLPPVLTAGS